jgi:hypothetical protein
MSVNGVGSCKGDTKSVAAVGGGRGLLDSVVYPWTELAVTGEWGGME